MILPAPLCDRYRNPRVLGQGAFGVVLEAEDTHLGRSVAIKLLAPAMAETEAFLRFRQEGQVLARLNLPHVLGVFDSGTTEDGTSYLIFPLLSGGSLEERLKDGPLPAPEVRRLGAVLSKTLFELHSRGILHRDLKPPNLLFDEAGEVHLADFGLVADETTAQGLTRTGVIPGTPFFLAPECFWGQATQASSEQWSLAAVLAVAWKGVHPYGVCKMEAIQAALAQKGPWKLPVELAAAEVRPWRVLLKALARSSQDRYPNLGAFHEAWESAWEGRDGNPKLPEARAEAPTESRIGSSFWPSLAVAFGFFALGLSLPHLAPSRPDPGPQVVPSRDLPESQERVQNLFRTAFGREVPYPSLEVSLAPRLSQLRALEAKPLASILVAFEAELRPTFAAPESPHLEAGMQAWLGLCEWIGWLRRQAEEAEAGLSPRGARASLAKQIWDAQGPALKAAMAQISSQEPDLNTPASFLAHLALRSRAENHPPSPEEREHLLGILAGASPSLGNLAALLLSNSASNRLLSCSDHARLLEVLGPGRQENQATPPSARLLRAQLLARTFLRAQDRCPELSPLDRNLYLDPLFEIQGLATSPGKVQVLRGLFQETFRGGRPRPDWVLEALRPHAREIDLAFPESFQELEQLETRALGVDFPFRAGLTRVQDPEVLIQVFGDPGTPKLYRRFLRDWARRLELSEDLWLEDPNLGFFEGFRLFLPMASFWARIRADSQIPMGLSLDLVASVGDNFRDRLAAVWNRFQPEVEAAEREFLDALAELPLSPRRRQLLEFGIERLSHRQSPYQSGLSPGLEALAEGPAFEAGLWGMALFAANLRYALSVEFPCEARRRVAELFETRDFELALAIPASRVFFSHARLRLWIRMARSCKDAVEVPVFQKAVEDLERELNPMNPNKVRLVQGVRWDAFEFRFLAYQPLPPELASLLAALPKVPAGPEASSVAEP